ncbi:hypothetical protein GGR50DRAFT_674792 [Xylaria sp. CBS 124048]|nr:hypothetical protein GGR50DRAFT_674792 [Xylaria sp. CBS 124048]
MLDGAAEAMLGYRNPIVVVVVVDRWFLDFRISDSEIYLYLLYIYFFIFFFKVREKAQEEGPLSSDTGKKEIFWCVVAFLLFFILFHI